MDPWRSSPDREPPPALIDPPPASQAIPRPPLDRSFALLARPGDPASPSNYLTVPARLRAVGETVQVYVERAAIGAVADETLRAIVDRFDRLIVPGFAGWLGTAEDSDGDGRLTVLLTRRLDLASGRTGHLDGAFRPTDLDRSLPMPLSNGSDLIYVNAAIGPGPYLETILVHEYAHAVFETRRRRSGSAGAVASWLEEGLAHLAEDRFGRSTANLDYRVDAFLSDPDRSHLLADESTADGLRRDPSSRGAAFLLLRWCDGRSPHDLVADLSDDRLETDRLERAMGSPFADFYRSWTLAIARSSLGQPEDLGLDLLRPFGDQPLSGARFEPLGPDDGPATLELTGVACRFLRIASGSPDSLRVRVTTDGGADVQITALPLPRWPRIALSIHASDVTTGRSNIVLQLEEQAGLPTRIDTLTLLRDPSPGSVPTADSTTDSLTGDRLLEVLPTRRLGPAAIVRSTAIAIDRPRPGEALLIRVIARDARDRASAVWATLDASGRRP